MFMVENPVSNTTRAPSSAHGSFSDDFDLAHDPRPTTEGNVKLTSTINSEADVMCCRFNEEGSMLAAGLINGVIKVYSTETGNCIYSLSDQETLTGHLPVTSLRWKPASEHQTYGNVLLATYADGKVKHWHVSSSKCLSTIVENRQVLACAFNSSVDKFVTAGSDPKLYVYDEQTRQVLYTLGPSSSHLIMDGHMMRVFATQFVPGDDNVFLTAGWDDTVQFWDTRVDNKHCIRKIFGPHVCGDALDIMPGNHNILTGSWRHDNTLQMWQFGSGKLMKTFPADFNKSMLYCVQWQGADGIIAGGSDDNMMRCVDCATEQTTGRLIDLPRAVYSLDHNSRTRHPVIAVAGSNHVYMVKKL